MWINWWTRLGATRTGGRLPHESVHSLLSVHPVHAAALALMLVSFIPSLGFRYMANRAPMTHKIAFTVNGLCANFLRRLTKHNPATAGRRRGLTQTLPTRVLLSMGLLHRIQCYLVHTILDEHRVLVNSLDSDGGLWMPVCIIIYFA